MINRTLIDQGLQPTKQPKTVRSEEIRKSDLLYYPMTTFHISRNDDEEIGVITTDLDADAVLAFLEQTDACLYSVGEYDEEDECVERLNGEEWLDQNTEMRRCLK